MLNTLKRSPTEVRERTMQDFESACQECGKPILDREGYLRVDDAAALRGYLDQEERDREYEPGAPVDLDKLVSGTVVWRALHAGCDAYANLGYQIDINRLRTWPQLVDWTAHLMQKNWLRATDWHELLRQTAAGEGTRLRRLDGRHTEA